jgi:hypothetical protein
MDINKTVKKVLVIVSMFIIIVAISGCPKPCIESNFSFNITSQFTPDKDSIHINDTLYLVSSFPTQLIDQSSGQLIDYSNSTGIGFTLSVSTLPIGDTLAKDAVFDFNYSSISGRIYNDRSIPRPDGVQQLGYTEINGSYILEVGLIPQKKGNYILGISDGLSNGRKKNGDCEKAAFNISINNTNQHLYFIQEWIPGDILNDYGKMHVYYFKVY